MKTTRVNGYLYPVKENSSLESNYETEEKELDDVEKLDAIGVPSEEIRRMIIDSE